MTSMAARLGWAIALLFAAEPIRIVSPAAAFWTTPCILLASVLIAWGAEAAQFFVAQGFALAMLAWNPRESDPKPKDLPVPGCSAT